MNPEKIAECVLQIFEKGEEAENLINLSNEVMLYRYTEPCNLNIAIYEPVLCLILQGKKEMALGKRRLIAGPGESLIVSHQLPIVSKIAEASEKNPYLALVLKIDMDVARGLHLDFGELTSLNETPRSIEVDQTTDHLLDSLFRLLNAVLDPTDNIVLLPQIIREAHFRILQAPYGGMLRDLLRYDSHASYIAKATKMIREGYKETLSMPDIAQSIGMSISSFHQHFKAITESTPLQYQKDLRLIEAQRMLTTSPVSVSSVAFEVGYESPNQFSREYSRKFGVSPTADSNRQD